MNIQFLICDIVDNIVTDYDFLKAGLNIPLCTYLVSRSVNALHFYSSNLKQLTRVATMGYLPISVIFSSKVSYRILWDAPIYATYLRRKKWKLYLFGHCSSTLLFGGIFMHDTAVLSPTSGNLQSKSYHCFNIFYAVACVSSVVNLSSIRHWHEDF